MRIGIVGNIPPPTGGAEVFLREFLYCFLKKKTNTCGLVRWRKQISFYLPGRIERIFSTRPLVRRKGRLAVNYLFEAIQQKRRERKRDFQKRLLSHYTKQAFETARFFKSQKVELIQIHMLYPNLLFGALSSQFLSVPLVLTIHGMLEFRLLDYACAQYGMVAEFAAALLRKVDTVVVVSDEIAKACSERGARRIIKIAGGLDTSRFCPPSGSEKPGGNILFIGSVRQHKGAPLLIKAFEKAQADLPGDLVFVGERLINGPLFERASRNPRIRFLGVQGPDGVRKCLKEAGLVVLPSESEGLPISILEAMAYRRPVLAGETGDLGTLIRNGRNGFLIRQREPSALAQQMRKILKGKDLKAVGKEARQTVLPFDIQRVVHRYEKCYHQLLREGASHP